MSEVKLRLRLCVLCLLLMWQGQVFAQHEIHELADRPAAGTECLDCAFSSSGKTAIPGIAMVPPGAATPAHPAQRSSDAGTTQPGLIPEARAPPC